jgi:hypothetical protein
MRQNTPESRPGTSEFTISNGLAPQPEGLFLDPFFTSCYEQLNSLEAKIRSRALDADAAKAAESFLEECSVRTLVICFRKEPLNNLERSRLLDILLSCRALQLRLHGACYSVRD